MEEEVLQNSEMMQNVPAEDTQQNHDLSLEEPVQKQLQPEQQETRQDRNWRRLENKTKELEKELKFEREVNERLLKMTPQQHLSQKQEEIDELSSIPADEYLPKGKVEKLLERNRDKVKKETLDEVEQLLKKREQAQFMDHLKKRFPDFEEVVNPETLELLEDQEPELAKTIVASQDPFLIGLQSYKYIKAMNLAEKIPANRREKEVEKKLKENAKTVQSPQSFDKRPMAQAYRLTDVEKKALYEEMNRYANQASFSY